MTKICHFERNEKSPAWGRPLVHLGVNNPPVSDNAFQLPCRGGTLRVGIRLRWTGALLHRIGIRRSLPGALPSRQDKYPTSLDRCPTSLDRYPTALDR
ncbi:MAG: hypothetical protein ACPGWR_04760, partial [Ardenticatenaceae bacterium]